MPASCPMLMRIQLMTKLAHFSFRIEVPEVDLILFDDLPAGGLYHERYVDQGNDQAFALQQGLGLKLMELQPTQRLEMRRKRNVSSVGARTAFRLASACILAAFPVDRNDSEAPDESFALRATHDAGYPRRGGRVRARRRT